MALEMQWHPLLEVVWNGAYGDHPPVQQYNSAAVVFDLFFTANDKFDNISPDSIHIGGVSLFGGLPASELRLCYSMQFYASSSSPSDLVDGFCVDNTATLPYELWYFQDAGGIYPPDFNGLLNPAVDLPFAPPICFDVVHVSYICGDCDVSGGVDIDDVVYLISYIFSGGPPPNPLSVGDADCSGGVDIDDVVSLIAYIFSGGNAPCDTDGNGVPDC
jgi:hypothetical protein